jgi:hypothetical protein
MSAQLPLPARWAEEIADPRLRPAEERLEYLARDKRTISRSIRELVEWLVVRHGGSPEQAYDELREDDAVWQFLREVERRPMARHTIKSDD